jgi:cytochrome oxidase Cu insertion factor (SCO1/SenC/PrrC family)
MRNIVVALVLGTLLFRSAPGSAAARGPDPSTIPLVDQNGASFTLRELRGRPVLVTFVATRCSDACPIANAAFQGLAHDLAQRRLDALLLTVTLDPQFDTPFVLAHTARALGALPARWRFASGRVADVERLLAAFGVVVSPDAHGIPEAHSTFVYALGRDGTLSRTLLLSTALRAEALAALAAQVPVSPRTRARNSTKGSGAIARSPRNG